MKRNILGTLTRPEAFIDFMLANYNFIAEAYGFETNMSRRRLTEAQSLWMFDMDRVLKEMPPKTRQLDHFKQAAFLAFWLRRLLPVNETRLRHPPRGDETMFFEQRQIDFLRYGNEIAALLIGFQICLFYESARATRAANEVAFHRDRADYLRRVTFPQDLLMDYAMILKHKSLSPHSLYMMYRSLFATPQNGDRAPALAA